MSSVASPLFSGDSALEDNALALALVSDPFDLVFGDVAVPAPRHTAFVDISAEDNNEEVVLGDFPIEGCLESFRTREFLHHTY